MARVSIDIRSANRSWTDPGCYFTDPAGVGESLFNLREILVADGSIVTALNFTRCFAIFECAGQSLVWPGSFSCWGFVGFLLDSEVVPFPRT